MHDRGMAENVRKRDDRPKPYLARYRGPDGKERSRAFATKKEARDWKSEQRVAASRGEWIDPKLRRVQVGELGRRLLATKHDPNTRSWYSAMLRHVDDRWSHVMIGAVDHLDVQAWVGDLTAAGLGPDTVRGAFRVLHEVVKLALRQRLIGHDACLGVVLPRVARREMLFLDAEQVLTLAEALDEHDLRARAGWGVLVKFAAYSGCRAGEIGHLRVKHLDLLRHRAHIVGARKTYGVDGDTKTGRTRWVDLPRQLCDELAAHLAGREHAPEARVWTGIRGGPLDHRWWYTHRFAPVVAELAERDALPVVERVVDGEVVRRSIRFHDLRHTCVALLIAKGAQQYEVMEHLGHSKITTTIDTYGHLFPSVRDRIRSALEETWQEAVDADRASSRTKRGPSAFAAASGEPAKTL